MRIDTDDIDEFFAVAGRREPDLRQMDAAIQLHAPALEREFTTGAAGAAGAGLGYGRIPYRPKSARTTTIIPVLGLVPQKRHLALYACVVVDGEYLAERYRDRLGGVDCGRSCIRFTRFERIDPDGLAAFLSDVNTRYARGDQLYGH